jgi:hypothetical protein
MAAQPADRGADDGLRVQLVGVDDAGPVVELAPPAGVQGRRLADLGDRQRRGVGAGDAAQRAEEVRAKRGRVRRVGVGRERAGRRAALDPRHDEERPLQLRALVLEDQRLRRGDAAAMERLQRQELAAPVGLDQAAGRIAPQDQRPPRAADLGVEAVGLAARPAGDARQRLDDDRLAPGAGQVGGQARRDRRAQGAKSSIWVKPEGACGPMASCSSTPRPTSGRPPSWL